MNIRNAIVSAAAAISISVGSIPFTTTAAETHILTLLDYSGNVITSMTVNDGASPDLTEYETSSALNFYEGEMTQVGFSSWSVPVTNIKENKVARALSIKMTIAKNSDPKINEYYAKKGSVRLDGLKVTITKYTQVPDSNDPVGYKTEREVTDITAGCVAEPDTLEDIFKNGNSGTVNIYPIGSNRPIHTYSVSYFEGLGDTNGDKCVNASDASNVLSYYSKYSTGKDPKLSDEMIKKCDVDRNGSINSIDASLILRYYSLDLTTPGGVTWEDILR